MRNLDQVLENTKRIIKDAFVVLKVNRIFTRLLDDERFNNNFSIEKFEYDATRIAHQKKEELLANLHGQSTRDLISAFLNALWWSLYKDKSNNPDYQEMYDYMYLLGSNKIHEAYKQTLVDNERIHN